MSNGVGRFEQTMVFHPALMDDPEGLAAMTEEAKRHALRTQPDGARVEWDEPSYGPITMPRGAIDGDAAGDETPVRMHQVVVRGRRVQ